MITGVVVQQSKHKFAFFNEEYDYPKELHNQEITNVSNTASIVEVEIGTMSLTFGDGCNIRYFDNLVDIPQKHQLLLEFSDESCLENILDRETDLCVIQTHKYYEDKENGVSPLTPPNAEASDSSTGPYQIFAWVAIDAIEFAKSKGIYSSRKYNKNNWHDVRTIWKKLYSDINFGIEICA